MTVMGPVKGLAVITFSRGSAEDLWNAGKDREWPGAKSGMKPAARLTRVATVVADPVYRANTHAQQEAGPASLPFESFALVEAESKEDLRLVGQYIEDHFSHVEVYAI